MYLLDTLAAWLCYIYMNISNYILELGNYAYNAELVLISMQILIDMLTFLAHVNIGKNLRFAASAQENCTHRWKNYPIYNRTY